MCGELFAVEGVTAEEGEGTAGSVVSATHTLWLQLETKLQRFVHCHLRQSRLAFKRSRAEGVRLRPHVNIEPVGRLCLADLHGNKSITFKYMINSL